MRKTVIRIPNAQEDGPDYEIPAESRMFPQLSSHPAEYELPEAGFSSHPEVRFRTRVRIAESVPLYGVVDRGLAARFQPRIGVVWSLKDPRRSHRVYFGSSPWPQS